MARSGVRSRRLRGSRLPPRLFDLAQAPEELHVAGELPRGPAVAIVGTRHASPDGLRFARHLAGQLAVAGVAVLSGGAEGIDAHAHRGALDVGGVTVVVAPAGLLKPFPAEHAELYSRVVQSGGAYVSLVPALKAAERGAFFARNACLAALCHALVVVEAGFRSGARNAAKNARLLGRPVFAVPWPPWHGQGMGCLLELTLGARPLVTIADVLESLEEQRLHPVPMASTLRDPTPPPRNSTAPGAARAAEPSQALHAGPAARSVEERAVLESFNEGALHPDQVCARTGLPVGTVQRVLLELVLQRRLQADSMGRFLLSTTRT